MYLVEINSQMIGIIFNINFSTPLLNQTEQRMCFKCFQTSSIEQCVSWFTYTYFALFASIDSFLGLPNRGKFATELVRRNFLMMHIALEKLTSNPSCFSTFSISAGWRPCLWRILIFLCNNLKLWPPWLPKVEYINDPKHIDTIDTPGAAMVANNIGCMETQIIEGSSTKPQIQPNLFEGMNNSNKFLPRIFAA